MNMVLDTRLLENNWTPESTREKNNISTIEWEQTRSDIDDILGCYKWFKRIDIVLNWERKEIFLEEWNLRIDSEWWETIEINWVKVKINESLDVIELIEWPLAWEQLFTWWAATENAEKLGKRLPTVEELDAIMSAEWSENFTCIFPGWVNEDKTNFVQQNNIGCYWTNKSSVTNNSISAKTLVVSNPKFQDFCDISNIPLESFLSARCVKD